MVPCIPFYVPFLPYFKTLYHYLLLLLMFYDFAYFLKHRQSQLGRELTYPNSV